MKLTKLSVEEVSEHAAQHCLMSNHDHVVLILQSRQHRPQPRHDVDVRLAPRVSVPELVLVAPRELLREPLLHLLVGETLADSLENKERAHK